MTAVQVPAVPSTSVPLTAEPPTTAPPAAPDDHENEYDGWGVHRHRDPATGVVAEVRGDGVPVGLALPPALLDRPSRDVASAVLRTLVAASAGAREDLEGDAAEEGW